MSRLRKMVLGAALVLFASWIFANFARLTGDQHGGVRFILGTLFAALVLFRRKLPNTPAPARRPVWQLTAGIAGALAAIGGNIFGVHQVEWLGLIVLLYAC